jgi:hypothetical protein
VGSLTDISARKEVEAAPMRMNDTLEEKVAERTEAEERARALLSPSASPGHHRCAQFTPCVLDANGVIIAVNRARREFAVGNGGDPSQMSEGATTWRSAMRRRRRMFRWQARWRRPSGAPWRVSTMCRSSTSARRHRAALVRAQPELFSG